jgi:ABC-2 type transport system ATP-binding protein
MPAPAISVRGLRKRFGAVQSLDGLDLTVERGTVFGFLGPNGAGKTTTLRVLLGLVRPDEGAIEVLGHDPRAHGAEVRRAVGVLLEHDGLYHRLSARYNLDYHARIRRLPSGERARRVEELLRALDLWERRDEPVFGWSKGMRQKLAIARALMHRPELVLLDEPFSGLDPVAASELRATIVRLARVEGATVVMTTHDLAHVEKACDRVVVMKQGRAIADGAPDALVRGGDAVEVEASGEGLCTELLAAMQGEGRIRSYTVEGQSTRPTARLKCDPAQRRGLGSELVRRGVVLEELRTVGASLEEAFLELMGKGS